MKIAVLLIAIFGTSISNAQNLFNTNSTYAGSVPRDQWVLGGQPAVTTAYRNFFFRTPDGRLVYMDQGDTTYVADEGVGASQFSTDHFRLVQNNVPSTYLSTLQPWRTTFSHPTTLETSSLSVQSLDTSNSDAGVTATGSPLLFQKSDGESGLLYKGSSSYLAEIGPGAVLLTYAKASSLQGSSDFAGSAYAIANFQSILTGQSEFVAPVANDTAHGIAYVACNGCFSVTSLQPATGTQAIHFGPSATDQQFDVNSLTAYDPTDHRAFLRVFEGDSATTITSLTLFTGCAPNSGNMNGAISIQFPNGQSLGISADSLMSIIGWQHNPNGDMTLQARTIFTSGNLVSNGTISAETLTLSDVAGTVPIPSPAVLQYLYSNSTLGTEILVQNGSLSPGANTTVTLTQGQFTNSITTISAYSTSRERPAGALYIQSEGPNGMILNSTNEGPIIFCIDDEPIAQIDAKNGFILLSGHFRLPRVTTEVMMAMTDMQPGGQVFNTDRQTVCTYTEDGWEWCKMHKFHYHKTNQPQ